MERRRITLSDSHAPSALAHQFEDLQQQQESASLGMWVFLATEVMFFGGLFAGYTIYRNLYLPGFEAGSHMLNVTIGALNTAMLIGSSLTMAMRTSAWTSPPWTTPPPSRRARLLTHPRLAFYALRAIKSAPGNSRR